MLRSMYAGISGMRGFKTKLDVIGNNIANVNTSGFKKGRATFQDLMSQTTAGAQGSTATRGGINPMQVGLGAKMGTIDTIHTDGFLQPTDRPLDLAIEGDGMFIVGEDNGNNIHYTRAGNFYLDDDGNIVNPQGLFLFGAVAGDPMTLEKLRIPPEAKSFSISPNGTVTYTLEDGSSVDAGQVALANFSNPEGLIKAGNNLYLDSNNSGAPVINFPETGGTGSIAAGALEMSNVDLAEEFTEMITAQRGFQANTRIITTSDEILQELVNLKR